MDSANVKLHAARAFVRSLNILLKFARLYGFDHARTARQFDTAWSELHESIPITNESGLLLGASGAQLLLDGVPVEATPAERSFAQLLSAAGLASIQFTPKVSKDDFERLVRAFPTQNTKPSVLAERLKAALANIQTIRINEIRFVPEDASKGETLGAGLLTAQSLGADAGTVKDWLRDPQKLLQLIAAAEGSRGEPGAGAVGTGSGTTAPGTGIGTGKVDATGASGTAGTGETNNPGSDSRSEGKSTAGQRTYSGKIPDSELILSGTAAMSMASAAPPGPAGAIAGAAGHPGGGGAAPERPGDSGHGFYAWTSKDEEILGILKLLTHLGNTVSGGDGSYQPGPLQEELTKLPAQSQAMLRQALAAVAAQTPATNSKDPILLRLAEHLAIKFALERYQRGEVKVNAVRQMIEKMSREIEGLRRILGLHEQKLAEAGVIVESSADLLDRQFWAAVPERSKRTVLVSPEAWCIPARNIKQYVEELLQRGDNEAVIAILRNYVSCIQSPEFEARRRTAIGLADLADVYSCLGGQPLAPAIQAVGVQLSAERDDNLQGLISAAFVRLAQEAGAKRMFPALLQALDSLEAVEHQRPVFAQGIRQRIGVEKRVPEFLDDVLRGERALEGMEPLLRRIPRCTAENLILRFNRTSSRAEMQRLVNLSQGVGAEFMSSLSDILRSGSASDAAETAGLLSRLDPSVIKRRLPERLGDWPRQAQDRALRLVAMGGAPERGSLLLNLLPLADPILQPLAVDEIGLSEDLACIHALLLLAMGDPTHPHGPFVRLKAVEALGRLKAQDAVDFLRGIAEARSMFHWVHPTELRVAALQSLAKINSDLARDLALRSGFSALDLSMPPLDPLPNAKYFRRRRYPRVRLVHPIVAMAAAGQDTYRLEVRGLSLSGGIAASEKHVLPGTLVVMRIGAGLRPIRAQVLMRDVRAHGLGFEFAEMDLEERARLRKLLLDNMPAQNSEAQTLLVRAAS